MKKVEAWVVLRFDSVAENCKDLIAVKGVYESKEAASKAIEESAPGNADSAYTVIRTRRLVASDAFTPNETSSQERIQGFTTHHWWHNFHDNQGDSWD
jgi:hypothetical protein